MQCRWQHGSSGELDVFGATRYFAGHGHCPCVVEPANRLNQAKVLTHDKRIQESFDGHEQLGLHVHHHDAQEMVLAKPAGKPSKLSAFMGFMVSPSLGASFHKRPSPPPPPPTTSRQTAAGGEPAKVSSSTPSSRGSTDDDLIASPASVQLQGGGYGVDLGVATGDRRLLGVMVVSGSGGDEEKWVVRCSTASCWDPQQEQLAKMFGAAASRDVHHDQVEEGGEDATNQNNWESDSSSDLFDLDIWDGPNCI